MFPSHFYRVRVTSPSSQSQFKIIKNFSSIVRVKSWVKLSLFGENQEFQRQERNHGNCKNDRAPKNTEGCQVIESLLLDWWIRSTASEIYTKSCTVRGKELPDDSDVSESFLSSQSHLKIFRLESESWFGRIWVESLRVIGLQSRVNVESHEISRFFYDNFYYEMAPNML